MENVNEIRFSYLIFQYKIMPETENRSLEDIEMHFSDNSKRITDRHIAYVQSTLNNSQEPSSSTNNTNDNTIRSRENDGTGSRISGEQKMNCDSTAVYRNRGFVGDT